jgi:O-antigen/teichoic acid export membrane protein
LTVDVLGRLFKGLSANAFSQLVTVVVQLVGVPVLLHAWGPQVYGEWLVLVALPVYLSMTDLGFAQSAANDMTARVGRGDRTGALSVFQSLVRLVFAISIVGLAIVSFVLLNLRFLPYFRFEAIDAVSVRWILWVLSAQVFAGLVDSVTHAGFRAGGEYALHVGIAAGTRLLQFASIWIVALMGGTPVAAATAFFAVRVVATATAGFVLTRRHRWLTFGTEHANSDELKRLVSPAMANLAFPFAQAVTIQGMVLVVGSILGPIAVVIFSTLRTLTRVPLQLVYAASHAAEPEIAAAFGGGDRVLMRSLFLQTLRAGLWLAAVAAVVVSVAGSRILEWWTHGNVQMHWLLFAALLGSAVSSVLWYGALIVLRAANLHLRAASAYVVASLLSLACAGVLLAWRHDVAGAGLALLCMDAVMTVYTLRAAAQLLDIEPGDSLAQAADPSKLFLLARR